MGRSHRHRITVLLAVSLLVAVAGPATTLPAAATSAQGGAAPVGRVDGAHLAQNEVALVHEAAAAADHFGAAVAVGQGVLAVGAPLDDTGVTDGGSVSIFRRVGGAWTFDQLLTATDEQSDARFGAVLSFSNGRLVVASPGRERLYGFVDNGSDFVPFASPIDSPDGAGIDFGAAFDLAGGRLVAGAPGYGSGAGKVYSFSLWADGQWHLTDSFVPPSPAAGDRFGTSVAISTYRLAVGAPGRDSGGTDRGAVFLWTYNGINTYYEDTAVADPGGQVGDGFGVTVEVLDDLLVAGTSPTQPSRARVLAFTSRLATWDIVDVLTPPTVQAQSAFGTRLALSGQTLLIADELYDGGTWGGTLFAYQRSNAHFFDKVDEIRMVTAQADAGYGCAVDIEAGQFAVGASAWDGSAGAAQGSAFAYDGTYYHVKAGDTLTVPAATGVCANDIDAEADPIAVGSHGAASSGTLTLNGPGDFAFTPSVSSPREVTFAYTPTDGTTAGAQTNAYITVAPAPAGSPVFNNGKHTTTVMDVPVSLSDISNARYFRYRDRSGQWGAWQPIVNPQFTMRITGSRGVAQTMAVDVMGPGGAASYTWTITLDRLFVQFPGANRYLTAILASQATYPTGTCDGVVIATGMNYPDALSAAGLAGRIPGPVLLVSGDRLSAEVKAEIQRLTQGKASYKVYIMGGTVAVTAKMEASIKASLSGESVERFAGTDRYHTAQLVARKVIALEGDSATTYGLLIPGSEFTDGLMVGPYAYSGVPIFLIGSRIDAGLVRTLKDTHIEYLRVCGTTARIPDATLASLRAQVPYLQTPRIASSTDVYTRSVQAAQSLFPWSWSTLGIATAERYPDGLAAGCIEGEDRGPLLLTKTASLPAPVAAAISANKGTLGWIRFYGGDMAVSPAVRTSVTNLLK